MMACKFHTYQSKLALLKGSCKCSHKLLGLSPHCQCHHSSLECRITRGKHRTSRTRSRYRSKFLHCQRSQMCSLHSMNHRFQLGHPHTFCECHRLLCRVYTRSCRSPFHQLYSCQGKWLSHQCMLFYRRWLSLFAHMSLCSGQSRPKLRWLGTEQHRSRTGF